MSRLLAERSPILRSRGRRSPCSSPVSRSSNRHHDRGDGRETELPARDCCNWRRRPKRPAVPSCSVWLREWPCRRTECWRMEYRWTWRVSGTRVGLRWNGSRARDGPRISCVLPSVACPDEDAAIADLDFKRFDRLHGGHAHRSTRSQVELRSMTRADDRAVSTDGTIRQRLAIVRTDIFHREEFVSDADQQ